MKINRIQSNRRFNAFGMKFYVQDMPSRAKERKEQGFKYYLTLMGDDDVYRLVYNKITWEFPKFKTIKDAQRWVKFMSGEGDFITTW